MHQAGFEVFGCSTDEAEVNRRFAAELGVHFPLLSDAGGGAARELGILKESGTAERTTYLVDKAGTLRRVWYDVKVDGHADAVTREIQALA